MGKRKHKITLFKSIAFILSMMALISCTNKKTIGISNCTIEKENITINLECKNFFQTIKEATLLNEGHYYVFDGNNISCKTINENQMKIELKYGNMEINTNQEYRLNLKFPGGYIYADLLFESQTKDEKAVYPEDNYGQILIIRQSTAIGI